MFKGNYGFFDYKYNIEGYTGQDFGSIAQHLYLIISIILLIILLIRFRKTKTDNVLKVIRLIGIFITVFYIIKTSWESYYDIQRDGFNYCLLPLDACSMVIYACLLASFAKGKIKEYAQSWLCTGGVFCGLATMIILNALHYYPFFSFGAFYSMTWHFLMTFLGLFLIVTKYVDLKYKIVIQGFIFHLLFSLLVIPIDFIFDFDFMMYRDLGSIPFFEDIASKLTSLNLQFINPLMMLLLYFMAFNVVYFIYVVVKKIVLKKGVK